MAIRSSPTDPGRIAASRSPARRRAFFQRYPFLREFLAEQLPLAGGVFALGLGICLLLYGFVPDGERQFPVSGVALTVPQLLWLGLWTGYAMAIVGQASGTFVLAYTASILHFTGVSLSPTCLLIAFLNPFGALLGFRRNHLEGWRWFRRREADERGLPHGFRILTLARTSRDMRFGYGNDNVTFQNSTMFLTGLGIGVVGATIGIGGGFLLVPILALVYRLPMPIVVAARIVGPPKSPKVTSI